MLRAIILVVCLIPTLALEAQIVTAGTDSSALLQGQFVEWGVNECGVYAVPLSLVSGTVGTYGAYHPNVSSGLGGVYSPAGTWLFSDVCGDYWLPGSPEESFGMEWAEASSIFKNSQLSCAREDIQGNVHSYLGVGSLREATWQGRTTDAASAIQLTQKTSLDVTSRMITTSVQLCNLSSTPKTEIYYARSVDPDNEQAIVGGGTFTTQNSVLLQPNAGGVALATAEGLDFGCLLALVSSDPRARVAIGTDASTFSLTSPKALWEGGPGYSTNPGTVLTQDWAIGIAFRVDTLLPGQCTQLVYQHVMDQGALDELVDSLVPCPTPFALSSEARPTKANLRWMGSDAAVAYRLFGGPIGGSPVVRTLTTDSIRINGLSPGTTYQWTVRAICGVDTLSDASPLQTFSTPLMRSAGLLTDWSLAPNPASGSVRLQGEDLTKAKWVELTDLTGRLIQRTALTGENNLELSLDGLSPGLYLVVMRGPDGTDQRRLVVE